jgi:hypothetical protein
MSLLVAAPQLLADAASDLAGLGSTISTANATAAATTTGLLPAAADEISTEIAALFSTHGQRFQRLSAQVAAFHEQFVQSLGASANAYATAEASAVQTLRNAINAPAQAALGHPLTVAVGHVESALPAGGGIQAVRSALQLAPTGGARAGALPSLLSSVTNAAVKPAALIPPSLANRIETVYNNVEPYVQYGFQLLVYAANFVVPFGLANQITYLYNLFEPIVQAGLFNTLDWLSGAISFSQGVANFWAATTSSVNFFIQTEINWIRSFLPPLPPFPPFL